MDPDRIWAATSNEIKTLAKPTIFTVWLYIQALEREHRAKELIYKQELEKQKLMEKQLMTQKAAPMKPILINFSKKKIIETRTNNDGSICKFLC